MFTVLHPSVSGLSIPLVALVTWEMFGHWTCAFRELLLLAVFSVAIVVLEQQLTALITVPRQSLARDVHGIGSPSERPAHGTPGSSREPSLFSALPEVNLSQVRVRSCQKMWDDPAPEYLHVPKDFRPSMTSEEQVLTLQTLKTFIEVLESRGLTYLLYGGSLLGSYRHHGFIPWDDDVDVLLNTSQKAEVRRALASVPGFHLFAPENFQWKFNRMDMWSNGFKDFKWPFVDIFFFAENATHVWGEMPAYRHFLFPKTDVFPLGRRPFEGSMLAVPRRTGVVLQVNYQTSLCSPLSLCHKQKQRLPRSRSVACSQLHPYFPFVRRRRLAPGRVLEVLARGKTVLQKRELPDPD